MGVEGEGVPWVVGRKVCDVRVPFVPSLLVYFGKGKRRGEYWFGRDASFFVGVVSWCLGEKCVDAVPFG